MKYKVGDKVKLSLRDRQYDPKVYKRLAALPLQIVTIKGVGEHYQRYLLKEIYWDGSKMK